MKWILLGITTLWTLTLTAQVHLFRSYSDTIDSQVFILVLKDKDAFTDWAVREQIPILGQYDPANIAVLRISTRVFQEKIAKHPQILFVMPASGHPRAELPVPGQNIFVNKINIAQQLFPQLNGAGITLSIKEFRFDSLDVDLQNRVKASPGADAELTTHAGIMASLIAGAGNSDLAGASAAPGCQLISTSYGLLLPEEDYAAQAVTVQNHSYGVDIENFYGANALAYDVSTLENPALLHVFSAGNKGTAAPVSGKYADVDGFANLTGNFKMAKNVLTVGAVDSLGNLAFFSSRGPAYDGRLKPDLVAFGNDGSSGAAALVSGSAAVLQQAYRELFDTLPGSDLVRSVLLNAAEDRGRTGPDFEYGFGNLNLKNALETVLGRQFFASEVSDGQMISFPLQIPGHVQQAKITLVWNDPPALPGSKTALVHDLDLRLITPGGQTVLPWVLNTTALADSLRLQATRGLDTLNNVEQITLDYPIAGQYNLQVLGTKLSSASQHFSIAYSWDTIGHFAWTYPIRHDPAVAAREVLLGWETKVASQPGILSWKPVGDTNWRLIDSAVALNVGIHRWLLPDTFTEAQVRMQIGTQLVDSDTFLICKELRLKVGFSCPDSVGLFWNPVASGGTYVVYGLGPYYLEPLLETRDTFVSLQKSQYPQQRFAVAALGQHHASRSRRSAAPDIRQQGVQCYQKSFIAALKNDNQVEVTLELGTLFGVTEVQFEKWEDGEFSQLKSFTTFDTTRFTYTDLLPKQGRNAYRAVLLTSNSGAVRSDTVSVYFSGNKNWLVFPNPIATAGTLQVLSEGDGTTEFKLFDARGGLVLTRILTENHVEIPMPFLPNGFYFFEAREQGERLWGGGLSIQHW